MVWGPPFVLLLQASQMSGKAWILWSPKGFSLMILPCIYEHPFCTRHCAVTVVTQGPGPALVRFGMCRCGSRHGQVIEVTTQQERCVLWRYLEKAVMNYISGTIREGVPKKMKSELGFQGQTERCPQGEAVCVKEGAIKQHDSVTERCTRQWRQKSRSHGWASLADHTKALPGHSL